MATVVSVPLVSDFTFVALKRTEIKRVPDGGVDQFGNATADAKRLREEAGAWLQAMRKAAGLSQIQLAEKLGLKYYTFVSQVENGFGRVPSESMEAWASALGLAPAEFARHLLSYYDPELHGCSLGANVDCYSVLRSGEAKEWVMGSG